MKFVVNPFTGDLNPYSNPVTKPISFANFDYNTQSPFLLHTTLGNSRILSVIVGIDIAFNGSGLSLSLGDNSNNQSLISVDEIALNNVDKFTFSPFLFYVNSTQINLYLNLGSSTTGSGSVYLLEA